MKRVLTGKRILIVEDEFLVADFIEDILEDLGAVVIGPVARIGEAIPLARDEQLDAAILDINLNGRRSDPIAEVLKSRKIPYLIATGYGEAELAGGAPVLCKPFTVEKLSNELDALLKSADAD